ncbi:MAG: hypothetical protein WCE62_16850, partial [Polyangiales bacterium]
MLGQDVDGNGVQDEDEQALVELFCPTLVLNGEDVAGGLQICPEPVEIVTSELYGHAVSEASDFAGNIRFLPTNPDLSWIEFKDYLFDSSGIPNELEPDCVQYTEYLVRFHFDYGGFGPGCTELWSKSNNDQPAGWRHIY